MQIKSIDIINISVGVYMYTFIHIHILISIIQICPWRGRNTRKNKLTNQVLFFSSMRLDIKQELYVMHVVIIKRRNTL